MLPADDLTLAIDIQSRSYALLRWIAEAVEKGFIPATRDHEYADDSDSAFDWIEEHYLDLPTHMRPDRHHHQQFTNFFSTYVTSSFDIVENPGTQFRGSRRRCYCEFCSYLVDAPHLRAKQLLKRDKIRAEELMIDRVAVLANDEGIDVQRDDAIGIAQDDDTRRSAGYSAYGHWLIRRMNGDTDGKSVLALWRQIAWRPTGSPIRNFKLRYKDFVDAEESLDHAMGTALL